MNDATNRLRAAHDATAGMPDDARALSQIHDRIGSSPAGRVTRRRRAAWVGGGLAGAGCAGLALALVLSNASVAPRGPVDDRVIADPSATQSAASVRPAAWYADQAETAVDLSDAILQVDSTTGVQHPEQPAMNFSRSREIMSADGTSSRWILIKALDGDPSKDEGAEDDKYVNPDGTLTYVYTSPTRGVYTVFHPVLDPDIVDEVGTIDEQSKKYVESVRGLAADVRAFDADPAITKGGGVATDIEGRAATCFDYSVGPEPTEIPERVPNEPMTIEGTQPMTVVGWSARFCFDDATTLPLFHESTSRYILPGADAESVSKNTTTFVWYENTEENQALLQPGTEGLREVSQEQFAQASAD